MTCNNNFSLRNVDTFTLTIPKINNTIITLQRTNIPGLSLPSAIVTNPFTNLKEPGDHIEWDPLRTTFKLDEQFESYIDIFSWMVNLGFPTSHEEYRQNLSVRKERSDLISDGILTLYDNSFNPIIEIVYANIWPTYISDVDLESNPSDDKVLDVNATFNYDYYFIRKMG